MEDGEPVRRTFFPYLRTMPLMSEELEVHSLTTSDRMFSIVVCLSCVMTLINLRVLKARRIRVDSAYDQPHRAAQ